MAKETHIENIECSRFLKTSRVNGGEELFENKKSFFLIRRNLLF
jgi:hypothetical protein